MDERKRIQFKYNRKLKIIDNKIRRLYDEKSKIQDNFFKEIQKLNE